MGLETVLLIRRGSQKEDATVDALQKRYHLLLATSGKQALTLARQQLMAAIVLDAASLRTPGDRLCRQLRTEFPTLPIIHIHPEDSPDSPADVLFTPPVTPRRLTNALERLIKDRGDEIITCGPFAMNVPRRVLIVHGQESQLNPKVALLVELFLRHPNETIDRKRLMETIWQTDYLGDTRTLDVHIRWVRQALENSGSEPRRLNTVRKIGYRLDVPEITPPAPLTKPAVSRGKSASSHVAPGRSTDSDATAYIPAGGQPPGSDHHATTTAPAASASPNPDSQAARR